MLKKKLPLIPGYNFHDHDKLLKDNHSKKQVFNFHGNVSLVRDKTQTVTKPEVDAKVVDLVAKYYSKPKVSGSKKAIPRFVLRFFTYYKEGVPESRLEQSRVRKCILYFFLEDGTVQICEPKEDNSCISQGTIIKRHLIYNEETKKNYTHSDFVPIGNEVLIYGKRFKIVDCDKFTKKFFQKLSIDVGEPQDYPKDTYREVQKVSKKDGRIHLTEHDWELKRFLEYSFKGRRCNLTKDEKYLSKQFFSNEKKVLQFFAVWDDRKRLYGEYRYFIFQYFLADDMIKISEKLPSNSGRDPFPVFIRKTKCPHPDGGYYHWKHLKIGATFFVFSKPFYLYDCDKFTRKFYNKREMPQPEAKEVKLPEKEGVKVIPPPHNGFGTEDDSLNSWKYLFIKPLRKDVQRLIKYDKVSLRFAANMIVKNKRDKKRAFVVNFHLADNTVSVFEKEVRNSGIRGGKFIERRKMKNPKTGKNYDETDLFVGAVLNISEFMFYLFEADERTLLFMEDNKERFMKANVEQILFNVKNRGGVGEISVDTMDAMKFRSLLLEKKLIQCDHELITLLRKFADKQRKAIDFSAFRSALASATDLESKKKEAEIYESNEKENLGTQAAKVYKTFCEKYEERPFLFQQLLKKETDRNMHGVITGEEMKRMVKNSLNPKGVVNFSDKEVDLLNSVVFKNQKKLSLHEFVRRIKFEK